MIYGNYREYRYMDKEKCNEGTSEEKKWYAEYTWMKLHFKQISLLVSLNYCTLMTEAYIGRCA